MPLRVIFAGTPEFARLALAAIHAAGHTVPLVLTQPDRPAGRGLHLQPSAVKQFAQSHAMPVCQPRSLRLDGKFPDDARAANTALLAAQADVMVVVAYGLILPQWALDLPKHGCLNIHASLLPRWRGAAPIHRAIEAGDTHTGITIMQMDAGLDTGAMLRVDSLAIAPDDTTASLHDRLAVLGGQAIVQALADVQLGPLRTTAQPAEGVTYAAKIDKSESAIDWTQAADVIARRIRALNPAPGASSQLNGETVKIWRADVQANGQAQADAQVHDSAKRIAPGQVIAVSVEGIQVATGSGVLTLAELQRAGGKRLAVADFLRGHAVHAGMQFNRAAG